MIDDLLHHYPDSLWIRLHRDKLHLMNPDGSVIKTEYFSQSYGNLEHILENDQYVREALQKLLTDISPLQKIRMKYAVIRVMEQEVDRLSETQIQALQTLGTETGISHVVVYNADGLARSEEPNNIMETRNFMTQAKIILIIVIVAMVASMWFLTL